MPDESASVIDGPQLMSVGGYLISDATMRAVLARAVREAALALANPQTRANVYQQLRLSPYRENKLHFRTALNTNLSDLLNGMASARQSSKTEILTALDSLIDLEFYMPVKEHWRNWKGSTDVIVAGALADDGTIPVAYDLTGREVQLQSAEEPPATPTLALVPVETDFSNTTTLGGSIVLPGAPPPTEPDGVYMVYSRVYDDHEGFLHGNPEFEVHAFRKHSQTVFVPFSCSGESQYDGGPYRNYNQDDEHWYGRVLLAAESLLDDPYYVDDRLLLLMWEDDVDRCGQSGGMPPKTSAELRDDINDAAGRIIGVGFPYDSTTLWARFKQAIVDILTGSFFQEDDFVGYMELPGSGYGCWPESGPVSVDIYNEDRISTGDATLDITFEHARGPICYSPPPLPPGSGTISGPGTVHPSDYCTYVGLGTGGEPPYTYQWWKDYTLVGSGEEISLATGTSNFVLKLRFWDANWRPGETTKNITVSSGAVYCIQ
jgi:hypothetical protein